MNSIILSGRVAAKLRENETPNGNRVIHFPIAVRKSFKKDENGNYPVNYFRVDAWNTLADTCKGRLGIGDLINVLGRLDMDVYPDDQGKKQYRAKITAGNIEFLTPRKDGKEVSSTPEAEDLTIPFNQMVMIDDDNIPF